MKSARTVLLRAYVHMVLYICPPRPSFGILYKGESLNRSRHRQSAATQEQSALDDGKDFTTEARMAMELAVLIIVIMTHHYVKYSLIACG